MIGHCFCRIAIFIAVVGMLSGHAVAQLPDFRISPDSITFSNPTPVEGEEIMIWVNVENVGDATPTMNEDLGVNLYEGDPRNSQPLQIECRDVIIELKPGQSRRLKARWRPPPGQTEVYAVVNPDGDTHIQESDERNNIAHTTIVAEAVTFPSATPAQIENAIAKGVAWIEAQQGKHSRTCLQCGSDNQIILSCVTCDASLKGLAENFRPGSGWNFGEDRTQETALALQALLGAGRTPDSPAVEKGLKFLLEQDWNGFSVYHYAVVVPVLVALRDTAYWERAQFAVNRLVEKQLPVKGSAFADPRDDGGWGYGFTADGAHMNMVIYALYAAKQAGLEIPQQTWERAEKWVRRNQTETGGWLYNLVENGSPWAVGVYGSMTATGLWALRACGASVEDRQIQKGIAWVKRHWTLTRNPGANSWLYYYLLSLQRFCDIPPVQETLAGHAWYDEISGMMVARQEPDGRWRGAESDFLSTCFAVMSLSRALVGPTQPNIGIVPRSLRFSPPAPRVGEAVRLSATLRNTGTPFDGILNVGFYADDVEVATAEVLWTSTLGETSISADWVPTAAGDVTVAARIETEAALVKADVPIRPLVSEILTVYPQSTSATDAQLAMPQKIGDNLYQLGNVTVDTNKREVRVLGEINIVGADANIEFFACGKLGKTHESVLILHAEPFYMFTALGIIELEYGMNLVKEGDALQPEGSRVEIWVEWERGDEVVSHRAEQLLWNAFQERPMQETPWVFTARIINNQLTAQLFHNIIAVYRDPDALFNHPLPTGTDDNTYRVNTDVIPPQGTKVTVIIRPANA